MDALELIVVISAVISRAVLASSNGASVTTDSYTTMTKNIFRHRDSTELFESMIVRYMREINNDSPVVHLIVDSATTANTPDNIGTRIVERFAKFATPLVVLSLKTDRCGNSSRINVTGVHRRDCETCSKFRHVVAIFPSLESAHPENLQSVYDEMWNAAARFVVIIGEDRSINRESAAKLLRRFWSLDCPRVIVTAPDTSRKNGVATYGYDPYDVNDNGQGTVYIVRPDGPLFAEKLKDLRGHRVRTSLYRHRPHASFTSEMSLEGATGLDVEVLRYTAKLLNFTIDLRTGEADAVSRVVSLPNGKLVGPIGDVLTARSEYLANGQFLEVLHLYNRSLDFVYPRWRSHSVLVVRRDSARSSIVRWIRAIGNEEQRQPRDSLVPLAVGLGLVAIILHLRLSKKRAVTVALLTIIELVLFQRLPKIGRATFERIFCLAWIYGAFVVCTVYQGNLVNDLTSPAVFDDIKTLRDLVDRTESLRLIVRPYERRILEFWSDASRDDETRRNLAERSFVQLNFSACLAQMRDSRNVACSIDESYGRYALGQVRRYELMLRDNPEARVVGKARDYLIPPIHILDESLVDFWKIYVVRRGLPYLVMMNEAITRAVEFGLVDKWHRDDRDAYFREPEASSEPRSLGVTHMGYTFAILIVGHILAAVAFLGEIARARARYTFSSFQSLRDRWTTRL